jgi:hypothetical protein
MCPVCLAGLYIAGGVSAGGITKFLATKLSRNRPEPTVTPTTPKAEGDDHATDDRIEN